METPPIYPQLSVPTQTPTGLCLRATNLSPAMSYFAAVDL